jgi:hypothetical protein
VNSWSQRVVNRATLPALLALLLIPLFAYLNVGGDDFDPQFYAAGRAWPHIFDAVPVRVVQKGGVFGIFLPWAVAVVQPITLLPLVWARAIIQAGTVSALLLLAGPRPLAWVATLSSAPAILLIFNYANLDALAGVGVLLPPAGGLLLLAMKPQALGLAGIVWLAERRWRAFIPLAIIVLLATLLWPEWLVRIRQSPAGALNVSLFPWTLLVAAPLLWQALRRRDALLAALTTPLVAPYIAIYSLAPAIALLSRRRWWMGALANAASWVVLWWLMRRMSASGM